MSSMGLQEIEKTKIKCARKFFEEMNCRYAPENVKYDVVDSFGKSMVASEITWGVLSCMGR